MDATRRAPLLQSRTHLAWPGGSSAVRRSPLQLLALISYRSPAILSVSWLVPCLVAIYGSCCYYSTVCFYQSAARQQRRYGSDYPRFWAACHYYWLRRLLTEQLGHCIRRSPPSLSSPYWCLPWSWVAARLFGAVASAWFPLKMQVTTQETSWDLHRAHQAQSFALF